MRRTIFTVEIEHFRVLCPQEGILLIRDLLWAEARRMGLPPHKVVISLNGTTKDGGIDAKVEAAPSGDCLLAKGDSFFQIKTGKSFKPWQAADLKAELFGKSTATPSRKLLGEGLLSCLKRRGRYVLITLGHDLLEHQHRQARETLQQLLAACGYKKARVEVIGVGQLLGSLVHLPSLCLELNGRSNAVFQTVATWAARADMQPALKLGDPQKRIIDELQSILRGDEYQHCRVIGEPGIGKSRTVLEAISAEDLRSSTIYVQSGEGLQRDALLNELIKSDRDYSVTLVVDDCDERNRASIWSALKDKSGLKLVTIDHGPDQSFDSSMKVLQFPSLSSEQIEEILAEYIGKRIDLYKWAEWCSGSPRVAHAVGNNLKQNPDDILKEPATIDLWERFVVGHKARDSSEAEQHLLVLRHLALFERFGFKQPVLSEARFISDLVRRADTTITWAKFQQIVRHHRGRRILQGNHTLFLVPKALHAHLWLTFWDNYGIEFDVEDLRREIPPGLLNGFLRLFCYAHQSNVAQQHVRQLLCPMRGPYRSRDFLISEPGTRFLSHLAEADPEATLHLLESSFGTWSLEELRAWQCGRQNVVWALEKLAVWKHLFRRAARLLVRLALAVNARQSNISKATLLTLFAIGPEWAPTQAPPCDRFHILESLIRSKDVNERALGLDLCGQWFSTQYPMRVIGVEHQGLRPTIVFWSPITYGELYEAWKRAWKLLRDEMGGWESSEKQRGAVRLIDSAQCLIEVPAMSTEVLDTLFAFADDPNVDRRNLVHFVIQTTRFLGCRLPNPTIARIEKLDRKLTGRSFWDHVSRYVLLTDWAEDLTNVHGRPVRGNVLEGRIKKLAQELRSNHIFQHKYIPRLVCCEGIKLVQFGFELASGRKKPEMDEVVLKAVEEAVPNANAFFVSGYLKGLRQTDAVRSDELILRLLAKLSTRTIGVNSAWRSGWSVPVLTELLKLYRSGHIPAGAFSHVGITAAQCGIPKSLIDQIVRTLTKWKSEGSTELCLELLDHFYVRDGSMEKMSQPLVFSLLESKESFCGDGHISGYHWRHVARHFLKQYPKRDLDLFEAILERLPEIPLIHIGSDASLLASEIASRQPKETWSIVARTLESGAQDPFRLIQWLRDNGSEDRPEQGAIRLFHPGDVMEWIRRNPTHRKRMIDILPRTLDPLQGGSLTRLFLEKYGDDEEVAKSLISHFWRVGYSGPESEYLGRLRDAARRWLSEISSPRITSWLYRYIDRLGLMIESAQITEERER
jgi:hypothetical protein